MDAVHVKEAEAQSDDLVKEALINDAEIKDTKAFIMDKARTFDGIPFTIQRLCELLTSPGKHYHGTGTYLRALEKNINVVTTVTENGMRITGADEEEEAEKDAPIRVESNFIVSVDEMDEPLALKLERQNRTEKKEAIGENQNKTQRQIDETPTESSEETEKQTKAKESEAQEKQ
ncbi:hypothetical protein niasHT_003094 [Heterodera trifolii]|uniref:Uncharacterized protein n=1 Tax=Heterodera trifolii TaxID=157864 RepID=A0ABD2M4V6_9BILA